MPQDDLTHLPLQHIARFGWPLPPLAGGAPDEPDEPAVSDGTPADPDPAVPATEPAAASTSIELPFKLDEVENEEHRSWLQGRQAQMQSGFDRALNKMRDQYGEVAELAELKKQLADDATRDQALAKLLEPYGYELDDTEDPGEPADTPPEDARRPTVDAATQARIDAIEAHELARDAASAESEFMEHVAAGLDAYAETQGLDDAAELDVEVRDQVVANALALPRLDSGLLDMAQAITRTEAQNAKAAERDRAAYLKSKDVPDVDPTGGSGEPAVDLTDPMVRRKRAEAIAGRHFTQ